MFSLERALGESKQPPLRRRCCWAHAHVEAETRNNNADDKGQNLLQHRKYWIQGTEGKRLVG
jgi:hypothetical protein